MSAYQLAAALILAALVIGIPSTAIIVHDYRRNVK